MGPRFESVKVHQPSFGAPKGAPKCRRFLLTGSIEKFIIQFVFRFFRIAIEVRPFLRSEPAKRLPRRARSDGESEFPAEPEASDSKSATSKLVPIRARVHPFPFRTR